MWQHADENKQFHSLFSIYDWSQPASLPEAVLVKENYQRQVWRATIDGLSYYIKCYLRTGRLWRIKRWIRGAMCLKEWQVAKYAAGHGVACIQPVAYAVSTDAKSRLDSLLVTRAVKNSQTLDEHWLALTAGEGAERRQAAVAQLEDAVAALLAKAHHAGIAHADLHPGNMLVEVTGDCVAAVLVDLQSIRIGGTVSDRVAVHNLAQLNQWFRQNATLTQRMRLLRRYIAHRQELAGGGDLRWTGEQFKTWIEKLDRAAWKHSQKLWLSRDHRTLKTNKYYAQISLPDHWSGHVFLRSKRLWESSTVAGLTFNADAWRKLLTNPLDIPRRLAEQTRPIKNSRSGMVCRGKIRVGEHEIDVVCKQHFRRKPLARIWDCWRDSRALRAWKISYALLHRMLPVAQPLAVLEQRIGPYLKANLLITEEIRPCMNLRMLLTTLLPTLTPTMRRAVKLHLTTQLTTVLKRMQQRGFIHRDMKASNILVRNATPEGLCGQVSELRLVLIDLDGLKPKRRPTEQDAIRAMARLSFSADLSPYVTLTDRVRFLRAYLTRYGESAANWRRLWADIVTERETRFSDHTAG